ncbi:MAG TPA: pyridoxal phosphate-dependent aminotransferase [Bacteroidales bacterium]|nr:pyridoxal phosphate-dependent aminotransferase [Bacteroidales bacterium]
MTAISNRIHLLSESETLAMARMSRELKAQGYDVISLSLGEPDFNTPDHIKKAANNAIEQNFTFYPPVNGYLDLREAICQKLKKDNQLNFHPDQIVVSTGAKQSIANVVLSLVNPEEEVIIPAPYWVSYKEIIKLAEAKAVYVNADIKNDFKITPQQLEKAITPKTKLFIFSSPCNPTGSVYSKEELKALSLVFEKHKNVYIISDEIYEHINFGGKHESIAQFEEIRERVIIINGVSKAFAMTGWRIGYLAASLEIAKACNKLQGQITSGTCSIAQKASIAALTGEMDSVKKMLVSFQERRDLVVKLLKEIPGIKTNNPQGAFYVFPDVSSYFGKSDGTNIIKNAPELCDYLLKKVFVALVPGDAFGDPNCIRISYATSNNLLIEAIKRIKNALSELH